MAKNAGRHTRRWLRLREQVRARRGPCCRCGQPIDYSLAYPDPRSFSVDHVQALALHPHLAEDPSNLAAAHLRCNQAAGDRPLDPGLGIPSEDW